jgi:hypothetical protein
MTSVPVPTPGYDGCEWPIDPACFDDDWEALDPPTKARASALASATLHRLTGYRVGGCPLTVRPCKKGCAGPWPSYYDRYTLSGFLGAFWPQNWGGVWVNSCGCNTDCGCDALCEIALPPPVGEVYEVKLNGGIVVADQYRVDGNMLVWVGDQSGCPWPACQDLAAADTEPNTFSVTYLNSYPVDQLGAYACAVLAMEYAKACIGNSCQLPSGVTSVVRQGVSFEVATGAFPGGVTGIREVDSYIALWNPEGIRQAPTVWSPDMPRVRVAR